MMGLYYSTHPEPYKILLDVAGRFQSLLNESKRMNKFLKELTVVPAFRWKR
jgi:hypothetical protein